MTAWCWRFPKAEARPGCPPRGADPPVRMTTPVAGHDLFDHIQPAASSARQIGTRGRLRHAVHGLSHRSLFSIIYLMRHTDVWMMRAWHALPGHASRRGTETPDKAGTDPRCRGDVARRSVHRGCAMVPIGWLRGREGGQAGWRQARRHPASRQANRKSAPVRVETLATCPTSSSELPKRALRSVSA